MRKVACTHPCLHHALASFRRTAQGIVTALTAVASSLGYIDLSNADLSYACF